MVGRLLGIARVLAAADSYHTPGQPHRARINPVELGIPMGAWLARQQPGIPDTG
jgi:hypothetical protein